MQANSMENEFACIFFMDCSKFNNKVNWRGRYETPAGKARLGETPQAQAEGAPRPPLDKRVTGAEINMQFLAKPHLRGCLELVREYHLMKDTFSYPFRLQSEPANIKWRAFFYLCSSSSLSCSRGQSVRSE
ncbi:hypothetical protein BKC07_13505 [Peribacillus simplex]|nr:hypothetical protein BKC07_13505 [Peribacillus simplex]